MKKYFLVAGLIVTLTTVLMGTPGCSKTHSAASPTATAAVARLGYFDNVTHEPALVGIKEGIFQRNLGDTIFEPHSFTAGAVALEALSSRSIDAAYLGPNPAINSYVKSKGTSLVIVSGATIGGAGLVVAPEITTAADLMGKTLISPQLGTTQDVALRSWLNSKGFSVSLERPGDVTVAPTENATGLELFKQGKVHGAWVPEPWLTRYQMEAGGHILVNEADLWPNGKFPTTVLAINKDFFEQYPGTVKQLIESNVQSIQWINKHPDKRADVFNAVLMADSGKSLDRNLLNHAFDNITFSWNPLAGAFPELHDSAVQLHLANEGSLDGLVRLETLNAYLSSISLTTVSPDGLG